MVNVFWPHLVRGHEPNVEESLFGTWLNHLPGFIKAGLDAQVSTHSTLQFARLASRSFFLLKYTLRLRG